MSGPKSVLWTTAVVLGALFGSTPAGAQDVDLGGVWLLNYELSDEPRVSVPDAVGADPSSQACCGGGFGGGGFGPDPRSGYVGRPRDGGRRSQDEVDQLRAAMSDQLTAPRRMTIEHADGRELLVSYDDGRYVRLVLDNREHAGISGVSQISRQAWWEDEAVVAVVTLPNRQKVVHRLALRFEGTQLVVTTRLEPRGAQDEVFLRRVYDAGDPSGTGP